MVLVVPYIINSGGGGDTPGGIIPSGTIDIDANGKWPVKDYEYANVQVTPTYITPSTPIKENGTHYVAGYDKVQIKVPHYRIVTTASEMNRILSNANENETDVGLLCYYAGTEVTSEYSPNTYYMIWPNDTDNGS